MYEFIKEIESKIEKLNIDFLSEKITYRKNRVFYEIIAAQKELKQIK